jgi:flagellar biosynthetic protein FliR
MALFDLSGFAENQLLTLILVFLRVIAFFFALPIIGTQNLPLPLKILFSLLVTLCVFPTPEVNSFSVATFDLNFMVLGLRELLIGIFLGFLVRFVFFAVSIAAEIIGFSGGFTAATVFNPALGSQGNVLEQFHFVLAVLVFLSLNAHHFFIMEFVRSFSLLPLGVMELKVHSFGAIVEFFVFAFLTGFKLAAPIMIAVLLTNLSLGILGRAVPQVNVFMTSLQLTVVVSLSVLFFTMPFFINQMSDISLQFGDFFKAVVRSL